MVVPIWANCGARCQIEKFQTDRIPQEIREKLNSGVFFNKKVPHSLAG